MCSSFGRILEGELREIIGRRRAAVIQEDNKEPRFAEHVFHHHSEPVGDFRKAWATACVAAGIGKMICPRCGSEGTARRCETCKTDTRYSGKIFHDFRRTASRNMIEAGVPQAVAMLADFSRPERDDNNTDKTRTIGKFARHA